MIAVFNVIKFQDGLGLRRTDPGKKRVYIIHVYGVTWSAGRKFIFSE